ncbi:MAG: hydantoinase/oxoprolinase family protein [Salinirussus sp.]
MVRVGIDTGGTFTDAVLVDEDHVFTVKTPTTSDIISGVRTGFRKVCERAGIDPGTVQQFSHGSTVALNALLEENGARTAVFTTAGFSDVLELREGHRDAALLYAPCGERPWVPVPRRFRYGVPERITADGTVETPLDEPAVIDVIEELQSTDVESVAVCLLHAYRNPVHEERIDTLLTEHAPNLEVSLSSAVSPEIREYSRTATTAVDAYVRPIVGSYLSRLEASLREDGLEAPVTIMNSDGGVAGVEIAANRPITQLLSGPVGGVKAAQTVGEHLGIEDLVTLDMGGTSCDAALIEGGEPIEESHREVRGVKLNGPFVGIHTVGAGGGSIAHTTAEESLRVGPESAGANPGPACYGRGGGQPTVTDADLVLGILNPTDFAGGALDLDVTAAEEAIREHVAAPLGLELEEAALAIRNVIDTKLASAIRVVSMQEGYDPRRFSLVGFGGAGPAHACAVGEELGTSTIVFPANPGLLSAAGLLVSDVEHNYVRSLVETVATAKQESIDQAIATLVERGADELDAEDVAPKDREYVVSFDMMYVGQAHYLNVPLGVIQSADGGLPAAVRFTSENATELANRFERHHQRQYDFVDENNDIELVNLRVTARGAVSAPDIGMASGGSTVQNAQSGTREVVIDRDERATVPYYEWATLPAERSLEPPGIVESSNTTVWLPPDVEARLDGAKNIVVDLEGQ